MDSIFLGFASTVRRPIATTELGSMQVHRIEAVFTSYPYVYTCWSVIPALLHYNMKSKCKIEFLYIIYPYHLDSLMLSTLQSILISATKDVNLFIAKQQIIQIIASSWAQTNDHHGQFQGSSITIGLCSTEMGQSSLRP